MLQAVLRVVVINLFFLVLAVVELIVVSVDLLAVVRLLLLLISGAGPLLPRSVEYFFPLAATSLFLDLHQGLLLSEKELAILLRLRVLIDKLILLVRIGFTSAIKFLWLRDLGHRYDRLSHGIEQRLVLV